MASDTKPGLFSEADVERALNTYTKAAQKAAKSYGEKDLNPPPEWTATIRPLLVEALNAGLSPAARRVLEAALEMNAAMIARHIAQEATGIGEPRSTMPVWRAALAKERIAVVAMNGAVADYARSITEGTET